MKEEDLPIRLSSRLAKKLEHLLKLSLNSHEHSYVLTCSNGTCPQGWPGRNVGQSEIRVFTIFKFILFRQQSKFKLNLKYLNTIPLIRTLEGGRGRLHLYNDGQCLLLSLINLTKILRLFSGQ